MTFVLFFTLTNILLNFDRIVEPPFSYPFMTYQTSVEEGGPFCGGTLIDKDGLWILTAAHCLYNKPVEELKVRVGLHRFNYTATDVDENGATLEVNAFHAHPKYNSESLANDLALLHLNGPLPAGVTIDMIELDSGNYSSPGPAFVIGWGSLDVACKNYGSTVLRQVSAPLLSAKHCKNKEGKSFNMSKQICAGDLDAGKWHEVGCGDSGGPLLVFDTERDSPIQVGIVSWGYGDAPDVYTKVSAYQNWISACMAGQCDKS